jgi:phosphopantothenoylcysteine decarboxylase/phosphopantothenate--cysteine ligase
LRLHGIADNPVTTLVLSTSGSVLIAPAMHKAMFENDLLTRNLEKLKEHYQIVNPFSDEGAEKMAPTEDIVDSVFSLLREQDFQGRKIGITAGPTHEPIDPVRMITNRSSGKMGLALAREAFYRGAEVTLIYGPGTVKIPGHIKTINVETSEEMAKAISELKGIDFFISAAAISDFKIKASKEKLDSRKGPLNLRLEPSPKLLSKVNKEVVKVGFKAEHDVSEKELISSASKLLKEFYLQLVIANDVSRGVFGSDESQVYMVKKDGVKKLGLMGKDAVAKEIFDYLSGL